MARRSRERRGRSGRRTEDEVRYEDYSEGGACEQSGYHPQQGREYESGRSRRDCGAPAEGPPAGEFSGRRPGDDYGPGVYGQDAGIRQRAEQRGYAASGYGDVDEDYDYSAEEHAGRRGVGPQQKNHPHGGQAIGGAGIGAYVEGAFGQGGPLRRSIFQTGTEPRGHELPYATPSAGRQGGHRGKGPRGYQRSDQRILEEVCEELCDDDLIDASDIEVKVENGEVLLSGVVPDRFTKRRSEDVAERCRGVHDVHNQLRVKRAD
ncbi:MAG: hypothetical protein DCC67_00435 [Planctomycetota bacterium]|nr:MAG: hypothetical protein DCC67_00435 [Planctomycetota bacterium]